MPAEARPGIVKRLLATGPPRPPPPAPPPAVTIVGEVVRCAKEFGWLQKNRRILFTGLSKERFNLKGTFFHLPLIRIEPVKDYREFDGYLKKIEEFDWI